MSFTNVPGWKERAICRRCGILRCSPTLFFRLVPKSGHALPLFTQVKRMTTGGPGGSTSVMAYSIYESAFVSNRWGYASAQSIVFFVILLIISIIQFKAEKKGVFYQ